MTQTDLTVLQSLGFQLSKAAVAGNLTPFPASTMTTAQTSVQEDSFHFGPSANVPSQGETDTTNLNHITQAAEQLTSLATTNAHDVALAHFDSITLADAQAPHIVQNHFLLHG